MVCLGQPECAEDTPRGHVRQVALAVLLRPEGVDGGHRQRGLDGRERTIAGVGALQLLHDEAVGDGAEAGAPVAFQVRAEQAHLAHARDEFQRERALAEVRDDGRHRLRLDEAAHRVAHLALVVGELRFDVQQVYAAIGLHQGLAIRVM